MSVCEILYLGLIDYQQAWDMQKQFAAEIARGERPPTLLLLEHPHTYTFGRRGNLTNLLWDETELARRGVAVHWVDRGGDVTYHGPGQLVGYPLLPLGVLPKGKGNQIPKADYVGFIRRLEQVIIAAVAALGVKARQVEGLTGVWVDIKRSTVSKETSVLKNPSSNPSHPSAIAKLAAIGVKVDTQGISQHGFAINVNPDMSYWEGIIGCGLTYPEISLAQLLDSVPEMQVVMEALIQAFRQIFNYDTQ